MFYIINDQGNVNQSHNEISLHTFWNDYYQREEIAMLARIWIKGNPCALAGGNVNWCNHYKKKHNSMEFLQNIKNRATI